MAPVIEIEGLRKQYPRHFRGRRRGPIVAIDGLDLSVPEGGVFGFLGPNGSGKTTTIRCVLGLVRPTSGRMRLFGADVPRGLPAAIRSVGSIVESPAGRNTVAAIVVAWGWLAIGEGMVRGLLPDLQRWLIGENASIVLTWTGIRRLEASPTPLVALLTIVGCCLVFAVGSAVFFNRRDVVAA